MKCYLAVLSGILAGIAVLSCPMIEPAGATGLNVFNGPSPVGLDIDLSVSVSTGKAYFTFTNNSTGAAAGSAVHEIYFESGLSAWLQSNAGVSGVGFQSNVAGTSGASFSPPASPDSPPGGNALNPSWTTSLLLFQTTNGNKTTDTRAGFDANGQGGNPLNVNDTWVVWFTLVSAATTAEQILKDIFDQKGNSRIALHIGECVTGKSCAATVTQGDTTGQQNIVPLPPALLLFGTALIGLTALGRRRRAA